MANKSTSQIGTHITPEDTATNQKILASDNCDTTPVDTYLAMGDIYDIAAAEAAAALAAIAPIGNVSSSGAVTAGNLAIWIDADTIEDGGDIPDLTTLVTGDPSVTDGHLAVFDGDGYTIRDGGEAPGTAGSDTQVIFNDGGSYAGDAGMVYNKTSNTLTVDGAVLYRPAIRTVAGASATAAVTDEVLVINWASAAAVTLLAATGTGQRLTVKNIGAGVVTIAPPSGYIDGGANKTLLQWDSVTLVDQASGQWIIV